MEIVRTDYSVNWRWQTNKMIWYISYELRVAMLLAAFENLK
jgi:hypothetical protein